MAPNWPTSPVLNQIYPEGGFSWIFNGVGWDPLSGSGTFFYWPIFLSDLGADLALGNVLTLTMDRDLTLIQVPVFTVSESPLGASIQLDVNVDGISIYAAANLPQIQANDISSGQGTSPGVFTASAPSALLPADAVLTVDILQVGVTARGQNLMMWLTGRFP